LKELVIVAHATTTALNKICKKNVEGLAQVGLIFSYFLPNTLSLPAPFCIVIFL